MVKKVNLSKDSRPGSLQGPEGEFASPDSRLAIFQEITLGLNSTLEPMKLLEVLLDSSIRYTGATTGSVILLEGDTLRIVAVKE